MNPGRRFGGTQAVSTWRAAAGALRSLLLILLATLAACDGETGLRVRLSGASPLSSLHLQVEAVGSGRQVQRTFPEGGAAPTLPADVYLRLPDTALDIRVTVTALRLGGEASVATAEVRTRPRQVVELVFSIDGGGPPPDAAAELGDMAPPPDLGDMAPPPDLGDMAPPPDLAPDYCGRAVPTGCPLGNWCEGFESTPLAGIQVIKQNAHQPGMMLSAGTNVGTTTAQQCLGATAVRAGVTLPGEQVYFSHAVSGTPLWTRAYIYVPRSSPARGFSFLVLWTDTGGFGLGFDLTLDGKLIAGSDFSSGVLGPSAVTIAHDRWTCVELMLKPSPSDGAATVFVEGQEVLSRSAWPTQGTDPYYAILFGAFGETGRAQVPSEIFIDELAVGNARLGCR